MMKAEAKLLSMSARSGEIGLILDRTPLYPGGGGQPADQGQVQSSSGIFTVQNVEVQEEGKVVHRGYFERGSFGPLEQVTVHVDQQLRLYASRLHSAGHLIDHLYRHLYSRIEHPIATSHVQGNSFLRYAGMFDKKLHRYLLSLLQEEIRELLATSSSVVVKYYPSEIAAQLCKSPAVYVNHRGSCRVVSIVFRLDNGKINGQSATYCGGTHVVQLREIGKEIPLEFRTCKGGGTEVRYEIV